MTQKSLLVGPFNRVEGDLEIKLDVSDGRVTAAYANSPLFRGFERILLGKAPTEALTITPRICGICSISQSAAAARALAHAAGAQPSSQGEKVATLLHAVENLADHITHFNLFFMPDFTRPNYEGQAWFDRAVARFTAMKGSGLRQAVEARAELFHIVGLLGGKWPHTLAIQPGGATRAPSQRDKIRIGADLNAFRRYLETDLFGAKLECFVEVKSRDGLDAWTTGDVGLFLEISRDLGLDQLGVGQGRYLSFGAYPSADGVIFRQGIWQDGKLGMFDPAAITEDLSHAWMLGETQHPRSGQTAPDTLMRDEAYSWCKAPRLSGDVFETGALARQIIDGHPLAVDLAKEGSVRARIIGRLLEIARTQIALEALLQEIDPKQSFMEVVNIPQNGEGFGLVEAARGALGHWVRFEKGEITSYQIIAPTTWNFSPRDAQGTPGPVEAALVGAPVAEGEETPISVQHIVRSYDPCMVCTVH
ncbi:Periplasmic [NiFeSe] hydrogenase large subunit [Pelagimonas phthalicica]|uniref:Periplasmic [NiFeSe] hydrogenase large subunit n=1 Tax=Pelagimonas phthalicica TaxID=1037362 RepID=A0A238JD83_9RHOB|nr:nickel-dependent hydrogenase large subunit [Pelagimonas phthalicica]TDS93557.1 hydrogenase large subunit [Pelagimonas phthalicica]SMX27922.1 Periplasmic [NiFeSe] hydrogenase large subunit [Pelagimonas phthalicica]